MVLLGLGLIAQAAVAGQGPAARILVEPDFLISRDGEVPHVEAMVAAHPKRPNVLVAGVIVGGRPGGGYHCKSYATDDGGRSWVDRSFPEQVRFGGGDPQVAFTPAGTAIFTCLTMVKDDRGRTRAQLNAWRSEDGGLSWAPPADLGVSYDHEMLAVDQTTGRFAGRVYLAALYGRHYTLGMFRSDDDGRHWTGPVPITDGGGHGVNVTNLGVFSDGTLLTTWVDFPVVPAQDSTWPGSYYWTATSNDGGISFSTGRKAVALGPLFGRSNPDVRLSSDPSYAIDKSPLHRDRVYLAFTLFTADGPRVMFTRSDDRGATWRNSVPIGAVPKGAKQFMPRLAVDAKGTVGIAYSDTRESKDASGWSEYFTASVDGGDTFLPPTRVSSEPSRPGGVANERLEPSVFSEPNGAIALAFTSAASRWTNGGDYLGLTVDSADVFHPVWADARTGTFQLWTARVRVDRPPLPERPSVLDSFFPPETVAKLTLPVGPSVDVTKLVELTFDPTQYDPATGELVVRVRLANTSADSVFGPLELEVTGVSSFDQADAANAPLLLNATNGLSGKGARFDVSAAMGSDRVLAPGGRTGAVPIRLRMRDPRRTPSLTLLVRGVLRRSGGT